MIYIYYIYLSDIRQCTISVDVNHNQNLQTAKIFLWTVAKLKKQAFLDRILKRFFLKILRNLIWQQTLYPRIESMDLN